MLVILLTQLSLLIQAQDFSAYQYGEFRRQNKKLLYRILYPSSFDTSQSYPVIVFLHGAFEKGDDNESQLNIGGRFFLANRAAFPAIVIFPQCPHDQLWADFDTQMDSVSGLAKKWYFPFRKNPTMPTLLVKELLDSLRGHSYVNHAKIYIGGLSQGGMGVYDMVARYPDIFAAAFPICGAGLVSTAKNFAGKTAMWIFHGEKDDIVPPRFSRDFYSRLTKLKADVRYTEYHGVFHNSWINAFAEKELLTWLFSKAKS